MLLVEATLDTIAPPDKMLQPLADKLQEADGNVRYEKITSNHSFLGQRMKLTRLVGSWMEEMQR